MLNRIETRIMDYLFTLCRGKRTVLIAPEEILKNIARLDDTDRRPIRRFEITKKQLEIHMKNLVLDGYLDFSDTNDKAEHTLYVVTLTTRGEAFRREREERIKRRIASIAWKVLLSALAFAVSYVLWYLVER
jgi:hypothetical protein